MFKKTLTVTDLKRDINDLLGDLQGDEALQVVHRGKSIKVIVTQERYFNLLGLIDQLSSMSVADTALIRDTPVAVRKQRLKNKLKRNDSKEHKRGILDSRRVQSP